MVRKRYYIFVFIVSLIKMDLVFSVNDGDSACVEDSGEEGLYGGFLAIQPKPAVSSDVDKKENTGGPATLKKFSKKRGVSCFFLRKRKSLNDGK